MKDHQSTYNFGNPSFDLSSGDGNNFGSHNSNYSLGNFQFAQPHFDANLNLPTISHATFSMPSLGNGAGFAPPASSLTFTFETPPMIFSAPHAHAHLSQAHHATTSQTHHKPGPDIILEFGASAAKHTAHSAAHGLEFASLVINAAEAGHRIAHNATADIDSGMSAPEAVICNTLGSVSQAGTDLFLKGLVTGTTIAGIEAAALFSVGGFVTGNPLQVAGGGLAALTFANLAVPAFQGAGDIASTIGAGSTDLCHGAFNQARLLSKGGM